MKRLLLSLTLIPALISGLATAAKADPWTSINQREALLEENINLGIRNGVLTRAEAASLRTEFNVLVRMEEDYRRSDGLSYGERRDLDRRFDALSARIRALKHNPQERQEAPWVSINDRQDRIYSRIQQGVRLGTLTRDEAVRLRGEFQSLVRLEAEYRESRGGLSMDERLDLEKRLERLSARVTVERGNGASRY